MKIFNLSLNRSATTSIQEALTILGFKSTHDINIHNIQSWKEDGKPLLEHKIRNFDALTAGLGWFGEDVLAELLKNYPDAHYIVVRRKLDSWLHSWDQYKIAATSVDVITGSPYRPMVRTSHLLKIWCQHRKFLERTKIRNLLDVKIEDLNWDKLAPFLDKEIPDVPFPWTDTSGKYIKQLIETLDNLRDVHIASPSPLKLTKKTNPFKHFLLTKYNIGLYNSTKRLQPKSKNKTLLTPEGWMWHRYWLFREFCVPSVLRQTNQDFTWIVAVDKKTPKRQLKHIRTILPNNAQVIEISDLNEISEFIMSDAGDAQYTLTTVLDNDDMFREDAIEAIQTMIHRIIGRRQSDDHYIDIPAGYTVNEDMTQFYECELVNIKRSKRSSFVSYLSKGPSNINALRHHSLCDLSSKRISFIYEKLWIRMIHMANLSNQLMGSQCGIPKKFGIQIKTKLPAEFSGA